MEELDLLKRDWKKKENSYEQVSEITIYKMIHKKSSSIVKWILIISVIEILVWSAVSFSFDSDATFAEMKIPIRETILQGLTYFNYAVILLFIYLFYKNYIKISTTVSTKDLMKDILKTRKTVQYYVSYNLIMVAVYIIIGFTIGIIYNPEIVKLSYSVQNNGKVLFIAALVFIITISLFFGFFWLFYRLLYGRLLRRLVRNYRELKKIDL